VEKHSARRPANRRPPLRNALPSLCEFGVDNVRVLLPLVLLDPHLRRVSFASDSQSMTAAHLLERAQAREDAATRPRGVYSLRRRQNLDAHVLHRQPLHLVEQSVSEPLCQRRAPREHNVAIEGLAEVHVGAVDRLDHNLVHPGVFQPDDLGIEQDLRRPKPFGADLTKSACMAINVAQHGRSP
jgi:hypothetical protein